jgi:carboxyl-terminal processing protease
MNDYTPVRRRARILFIITLAFAGGAIVERSGWLPGASHREPPALTHTFAPFWQAWRLVFSHYVDRSAVVPEKMTHGAIEGMLASLGDIGHTTYLTAEDYKQLQSALQGEMEGIGARIGYRSRRPTIIQTMPNSPARTAGLMRGDVLLEVDDKPVADASLDRIVSEVRGSAGTVVRLRILRAGENHPRDLSITRGKVTIPDVMWCMVPGWQLAHIALFDFGVNTDKELNKAVSKARGLGAKGLILDLRANSGGLKEQAVAVTSQFISRGAVFIEQDSDGRRKEVPVTGSRDALDIPLCLLIEESTASAAEIFAGAIQDHHRGKLIGMRTIGTGTVLQPFILSDGSAILLAVAEWFTPHGRQIWKKGIMPDIEVKLPDDVAPLWPDEEIDLGSRTVSNTNDSQLHRAIEVMRDEIRPQ